MQNAKLVTVTQSPNELDDEIEITPFHTAVQNETGWHNLGIHAHPDILNYYHCHRKPFMVEHPIDHWLIQHHMADIQPKTEQTKTQNLNTLTVKQLQELCTAHKLTKSGKKQDLIQRLSPHINLADLPDNAATNSKYMAHLHQMATQYLNQAIKQINPINAPISTKFQAIKTAMGEYSLLDDHKILQALETTAQLNNQTTKPPKQLKTTQKSALAAIGIGTLLTAVLLYFLPGMAWYVYLILWAVFTGGSYNKLIEIQANENLTDKNI